MTAKKPRNRAAQDVTLVNLRPVKERLSALEERVASLEKALLAAVTDEEAVQEPGGLEAAHRALEERIRASRQGGAT